MSFVGVYVRALLPGGAAEQSGAVAPGDQLVAIDGDAVFVEWGKYGQYEFVLDVAKREMNGHLRGNEKSWRRLEYTEPMAAYQKKHHCGHDH